MDVKIKKMFITNFKGIKKREIVFSGNARIFGANATGKTTIADSLFWCLFGVDSNWNTKFSIRPLDSYGNMIHNIEISVKIIFDVDGTEIEFERISKENWVTKRGTQEKTLQGNVGSYSVDGYPRTEQEYKKAVSEIVSEDLFKMLTNPTYFPSLKWKEQREILMRFLSDVTDYELAKDKPEFEPLLAELQKAPSTDDIKAKYQKSLTEWKKKQSEIPVRIDEAEKQRVEIDLAELELERNAVQELINANSEKQKNTDLSSEDYNKIHAELMELKFAQSDYIRKANESLTEKRRSLSENISELEKSICLSKKRIEQCKNDIGFSEGRKLTASTKLDAVRDEWNTVKNSQFDENKQFCRTCGQLLPEDKISANRAEFEKAKQLELAGITQRGNWLKGEVDEVSSTISRLNEEVASLEKKISNLDKEKAEKERDLFILPTSVDVSADTEYLEIGRKIEEKLSELRKFDSAEDLKRELRAEETELRNRMEEVKAKFAKAEANRQIDDRIGELRAEQREVAQKVADMEKMIYLLESFIRYKMDMISESINGKFDGICFRLFELQVNGGLKETCECTVDGVPYSSLNNGHRIVAGLKIIKALQELYGVSAPIFVDNAESISDGNMPDMDCQMVCLYVSDDKELRVEVE